MTPLVEWLKQRPNTSPNSVSKSGVVFDHETKTYVGALMTNIGAVVVAPTGTYWPGCGRPEPTLGFKTYNEAFEAMARAVQNRTNENGSLVADRKLKIGIILYDRPEDTYYQLVSNGDGTVSLIALDSGLFAGKFKPSNLWDITLDEFSSHSRHSQPRHWFVPSASELREYAVGSWFVDFRQ